MARARGDQSTLDMLEWRPPGFTVGFDDDVLPWRGALHSKIVRALGQTLQTSKKSRDVIAEEMSEVLRQKISRTTIELWASDAKEGHRISLERATVVIMVTNCHDPLGFIASELNFVVVPERDADISELHLIEGHEQQAADHNARVEAWWRRG